MYSAEQLDQWLPINLKGSRGAGVSNVLFLGFQDFAGSHFIMYHVSASFPPYFCKCFCLFIGAWDSLDCLVSLGHAPVLSPPYDIISWTLYSAFSPSCSQIQSIGSQSLPWRALTRTRMKQQKLSHAFFNILLYYKYDILSLYQKIHSM